MNASFSTELESLMVNPVSSEGCFFYIDLQRVDTYLVLRHIHNGKMGNLCF